MKYDYRVSNHKKKYSKKFILSLVALIFLVVLAYFGMKLDVALQQKSNDTSKTVSGVSTVHFAPSTRVFRSKYFQFQAPDSWVAAAPDSNENKYVYRSYTGKLIEQEFTVYVDKGIPKSLPVTRVLPVKIEGKELIAYNVSAHCSKSIAKDRVGTKTVLQNEVRYSCIADSPQFNVIVGRVKGTTILKLTRPNGTEAYYQLYYRNLTVNPEPAHLREIIETFQVR